VQKLPLIVGVAGLALAAVIFVVASGRRRVYSGAFFLMLGVVTLANARRKS
jgi:hypothetical protein